MSTLRQIAARLCYTGLWIAVPVAVFTSNSLLGLVVQGLVISGSLMPLAKVAEANDDGIFRVESARGLKPCAAEKTLKN